MSKQRIAIIGGGMAGLSAAYYLSGSGKRDIHLFERNPNFGGLLGILNVNGVGFEGYYHHLFKRDKEITELTKELSLGNKLLYLPSKIGIYYENEIYPFSTPFDLLKFSPLPVKDRLRLGIVALYLQKFVNENNWKKLRDVPAGEWMRNYAGERAYEVIWKPLLAGKFGRYADEVSMAWLWSRLYLRGQSRGKAGGSEELVYFDGGFKVLVDKLIDEVKENGGKLYPNTGVSRISAAKERKLRLEFNNNSSIEAAEFHKVIVTVPNPIFVKLAPGLSDKLKQRLLKVKYRGAMVAVLKLKKQFMQDIYWLNVNDLSMDLLAVVEHTNFVSPQKYGGVHLLYAGNYPSQDSPIMSMRGEKLFDLICKELRTINPTFQREIIEKYWIFRDRFAQPVVTTDYHKYIPPVETGIPNLYLVNMAQVYPEDRGTNQAVRDGKAIAEKIIQQAY